ncbi:hypothetical protein [Streptomyces camelliae]|uniref:Secreted protein n=1 Tax=Streptomyces camelliae TaxID=3004093 RepID=A0ABY7P4T8_9ACTN|nr:hypothetical protein [Streptomyces sp. HUAS 2-6]WBO65544.1 hypothetical protein O1G22_23345 [Streptomyces sp. HUAS 2-6]
MAGFATLAGVSVAAADDPPTPPPASAPPVAVEDYGYPQADRILAEKGIKLKKGDGHILLADCDLAAQQIRVQTVKDESVGRQGTYCFKALGKSGRLTLELPRVFAVEAPDHPVSADLTANGETTTVNVPQGGFESVGEGTAGGARSVLVELRVTG